MSGTLPNGACDSHCHVFGPAELFPFDPDRTYTPDDAPKETLFELHRRLGLDRGVIVQPACHGFDHRALLDAIRAGAGRYRGVALVPETVNSEHIAVLHGGGIRGVRFNFMPHLSKPPSREGFRRVAGMLAPRGWHIVIHLTPASIDVVVDYLDGLEVPFVIDHMGRIDAGRGLDQAGFLRLLELADDPRAWIKVAAADRASAVGEPYPDVVPFMRRLIDKAPNRVLWGTDWPHPNIKGLQPREEILLALLNYVARDEVALRQILVENPNRLYKFTPA